MSSGSSVGWSAYSLTIPSESATSSSPQIPRREGQEQALPRADSTPESSLPSYGFEHQGETMSNQEGAQQAEVGGGNNPPLVPPPPGNGGGGDDDVSHRSGLGSHTSHRSGANNGNGGRGGQSVSSAAPMVPPIAELQIPAITRSSNAAGQQPRLSTAQGDACKAKYEKIFTRTTPIKEEDMDEVKVICAKGDRTAAGPKQFNIYRGLATESLEHKFGVAIHYIRGQQETEEGNQTKPQYIQEQFVGNLAKLDDADYRIRQWDLKMVLMVPAGIRDRNASNPASMFVYEQVYLLTSWNKIDWETACLWQWSINTHCDEEERVSSRWVRELFYESCTADLRELVCAEFDNLAVYFKGGITFMWILCHKLFALNRDTTAALKDFLKTIIVKKGLRRYKGENVWAFRREVLAVCTRLWEADDLPEETPIDVLTGLTLCSNDEFKRLFQSFLDNAQKDALRMPLSFKKPNTLYDLKVTLMNATSFYDSLSLSSKWNVSKRRIANVSGGASLNKCWNCGKPGCNVKICKEPRNEAKIDENRRKWKAAKNGERGGGPSGNNGQKSPQYEREKWGKPKHGNEIWYFKGEPYAYCSKKCKGGAVCGWNTTYTAKFHGQATYGPQAGSFNIRDVCPSHELAIAKYGPPNQEGTKAPAAPGGGTPGALSAATGGLSRSELQTKFSVIEDTITGNEARAVFEAFKAMLLN